MAGLGLEPESGSRFGTTPIGGPRMSAREKGRREKRHAGGLIGPEERGAEQAGPGRAGGRQRRGERLAGLGRVVKK
jgi:hypothetical protein